MVVGGETTGVFRFPRQALIPITPATTATIATKAKIKPALLFEIPETASDVRVRLETSIVLIADSATTDVASADERSISASSSRRFFRLRRSISMYFAF